MAKLLIVFATTDGHTMKVAEYLSAKAMERGLDVHIHDAENEPPSPIGFGAIILAASMHGGDYQKSIKEYIDQFHIAMNALPSAFVSVSLTAAGIDDKAWKDLKAKTVEFLESSNWDPTVEYVAGALMYRKYGFLKRWMMKRIAKANNSITDTTRNHVFTDWDALSEFLANFTEELKVDA